MRSSSGGMHVYGDRTGQDWAKELWPDDVPDPDWPDNWPAGSGVPYVGVGPGRRGRRGLALGLTFAVALGAGAGAVYLYKSEFARPASAATSPSPASPRGGTAAGVTEGVMTLGRVLAVGHDSVTVGDGPGQAISARATSATQFTGTARSLAQVRVGDTVAAQIAVSGGGATLVRLQDPASQP
jgi:hypothetical protein